MSKDMVSKVLLTDEQIAELYKNRKYLCFEPDITRSNMVAEAQLKAVIDEMRKCKRKVDYEMLYYSMVKEL